MLQIGLLQKCVNLKVNYAVQYAKIFSELPSFLEAAPTIVKRSLWL